MSFNSFEEVISFAMQKEKEAVAFYEDISRQEPYSGAKDTFYSFAKEEYKHISMLENLAKEKVEEYKRRNIPDLKRSDYLVDIEYRKGMPYNEILRLAMKREEKSLKFYNDLAEKAEMKDLRELFQALVREEAVHKLKLETIYDDYMAKTGD